jgi:hypothetical protein
VGTRMHRRPETCHRHGTSPSNPMPVSSALRRMADGSGLLSSRFNSRSRCACPAARVAERNAF